MRGLKHVYQYYEERFSDSGVAGVRMGEECSGRAGG